MGQDDPGGLACVCWLRGEGDQRRQTAEKWVIFVGGRTSRHGGTVR